MIRDKLIYEDLDYIRFKSKLLKNLISNYIEIYNYIETYSDIITVDTGLYYPRLHILLRKNVNRIQTSGEDYGERHIYEYVLRPRNNTKNIN